MTLADDGSASPVLCKVCEGIQLSQLAVPKCAFSKVISDCMNMELADRASGSPGCSTIELALCSMHSAATGQQNRAGTCNPR